MSHLSRTHQYLKIHRHLAVRLISLLVGGHGLFILATALDDQLDIHRTTHIVSGLAIDIPVLIGISLIYLSALLRRRKQTAWLVTMVAYAFYFGTSLAPLMADAHNHHGIILHIVQSVVLPITIVGLLLIFHKEYVVRSDPQGFRVASQYAVIVLAVTLIYGVVGFTLFDRTDFHQEITFGTAVHYTVDQFDLTTNKPLRPYTKRAHIFDDSLSAISTAAVVYVVLALFQPLRTRFSDQTQNRERMHGLLLANGAPSEDYFKLWPHDKQYFYNSSDQAGVAYHTWRGSAICLGDPAGKHSRFASLLDEFDELCYRNDWLPAFVHIQESNRALYEKHGFTLQKLGQEAVVDITNFQTEVIQTKYFRQIQNRFAKQGCTAELLQPPHHPAVLQRLKVVSDDWLSRGGRTERGFAMGYYSDEYMQQCAVFVVRDAAGTIQAFLNQLPAEFDTHEATYDLLRYTSEGLGNINDFLLMQFMHVLHAQGYSHLNLGLCPLTGLDAQDDEDRSNLIHSMLRFAYANGDRLYSFSGLYRFKAKYQPVWRDRYIAYQGGIRGFTRSMTALMRIMRVKTK